MWWSQGIAMVILASIATATKLAGQGCLNITVPVEVTAEVVKFIFPPFQDGFQASHFLSLGTNRLADGNPAPLYGAKSNITQKFPISTYYCTPEKSSGILQILTHGLGFDKR
jgi:hypothetical protein